MSSDSTPSNDVHNPARTRDARFSPPAYVLNKHASKVLDPDTAVRLKNQRDVRPTTYVAANLLIGLGDWQDSRLQAALQAAAELAGLRLGAVDFDRELVEVAERNGLRELADRLLTVRVSLEPLDDSTPSLPADAWPVLQNFRAGAADSPELIDRVSLDHLFTANSIGGAGYMGTGYMGTGYMGTGYMGTGYMGTGVSPSVAYGIPGSGGRAPVTWLGPEPTRCPDAARTARRPVVAILDTGAGRHPWLPDAIVDRNPTVDGALLIGMPEGPYSAESHGSVNDPLEGVLDSDAGHGTFIAGLIRQTCPDADILAARVMHGDGAVSEHVLLTALNRLVFRQALAVKQGDRAQAVDVLSLSLGYYHELPADQAMDHKLLAPLLELGRLGVVTVAAAGNDSTDRHFYPAGFAPHPHSQMPESLAALPVISVGALNPDERFVALFSNDGNWVLCRRPGAALVSTMPIDMNGSLGPIAEVRLANGERRATIDPDDYSGGFATWSGTSFAAPVLAGQIAQFIQQLPQFDDVAVSQAL
ncbi:MAG: hypothetical protein JWO63_3388, partial [Frankiales bacterium]|nr:hypothetical protein [Frankiales bacterium]